MNEQTGHTPEHHDDDVTGLRAAEYEDEYGYKGRPGSNYQPNGGGGKLINVVAGEVWNRSGIPQAWQAIRAFRSIYF